MADEKRGPSEGEAYGEAALTQALEGIDFPCSREELIEKAGDKEILWFKERPTVLLKDVFEKLSKDKFDTMNELVESVSREIEVIR